MPLFESVLTVGSDDTGHDVRFYGATSGRYMEWDESSDRLEFTDNATLSFGTGVDLRLWHNGTNSYVVNYAGNLNIGAAEADKDTIFLGDDGSGGETAYITLDGSQGFTTVQKDIQFADNIDAHFGAGSDMILHHNGTDNFIQSLNGDLKFIQYADDKDIIFQSDDGSGGVATYLLLDGSDPALIVSKKTILGDNVPLYIGSNVDLSSSKQTMDLVEIQLT